jgi:hypothetical protein
VQEVKVDGVVVSPTNYTVVGNALTWIGVGSAPWPQHQNVHLPDSSIDTFSVTYINGYPPDAMAKYAVAVLANEFSKACSGQKCRLPTGVTSIARAGITMEIQSGVFPHGLTGIREVDAFIGLWNPNGLTAGAKVWSP